MLTRILEESKKAGGPTELRRQLDLNLSLEDRKQQLDMGIEARLRTIKQLDDRIKRLIEDDRSTQQAHEKHLANIAAEEKRQTEEFNAKRSTQKQELENGENNIAKMKQESERLNDEIIIGKWLLALINRNPDALELVKRVAYLVEQEENPPANWTETLAYTLIKLARRELTDLGVLVPKRELDETKSTLTLTQLQSMNDRSILTHVLNPVSKFNRDPMKMTTDQKRILLEVYAQTGAYTHAGFTQLIKRLESSEKCIQHGTLMVFDYKQLKWICQIFSCTFSR